MSHGSARIGRVETAIHNSVEGHCARPRADHRSHDKPECPPPGPSTSIASGHDHCGEREGKCKDGVGKFNEFGPIANLRKHQMQQEVMEKTEIRTRTNSPAAKRTPLPGKCSSSVLSVSSCSILRL